MSRSRGLRTQYRKRRTYLPARWGHLEEVVVDGQTRVFSDLHFILQKVCDAYMEMPVFPAMAKRDYTGWTDPDGTVREPFRLPIYRDGVLLEHRTLAEAGVRPGAVWMPRRLFLDAYSEYTGLTPQPDAYMRARTYVESIRGQANRDLYHVGQYYHPGQNWFAGLRRARSRDGEKRRPVLFTPHDIDPVRHHIDPIHAEMFALHRRHPNGSSPVTTGQYMIEPDVLHHIGRFDVYETFLMRREAFEIGKLSRSNKRLWGWREVLGELAHLPVFDRELVLRMTADPEHWGTDGASMSAVENHLTQWLAVDRYERMEKPRAWAREAKVRRIRHGLYQTIGRAYIDYDPMKTEWFLADWFMEFLRRQAFRQRLTGQTFDIDFLLADIDRFHPDWQSYYRKGLDLRTIRRRLNRETAGMAGAPREGAWLEKVTPRTRRLTPAALSIFYHEMYEQMKD